MSTFITVGIAHHHAPLARLEQVVATAGGRASLQERALAAGCAEVLVLSTCSRVEVHAVLDLHDDEPGALRECWAVADRLVGLLVGRCAEPVGRATVAAGQDAVCHLFRVAAGVDSRIAGETEVLAQLRSAARAAAARAGEPHRLRRMVAAAVAAAREAARAEPRLVRRGLLAERAVARVLRGHRGERPMRTLVVGAGTMGRQVVAALPSEHCVAALLSRSAGAGGPGAPRVHPLEELPARLTDADVVFVATSAGRAILSAGAVRDALARRPERPLTIVDLSLPRNVDPAVAAVPGVRLLDLDDLADAGSGVRPDAGALAAVEAATAAAADDYCSEIRSRRAGPTIRGLRSGVERLALEQLRRTTRGMDLPEEALVRMASAVAGAVAHAPTVLAREAAAHGDDATLGLLRTAFRLDERSVVLSA